MTGRKSSEKASVPRPLISFLLVFLMVLTLLRVWRFSRTAALDGYREGALPWAYRDPSLARVFRMTQPSLRYGEILWITVPTSGDRYEPYWFRVMANYAWPYQSVLGVSGGPPMKALRVTVVAFEESGVVRIVRPGRPEIDIH